MDIALSLAAIVVSSSLLLVAAVAVKMTSPGPVICGQHRVGQRGKMFRLLEFRSMVQDAEKATGPVWSREADGRTTRVGKVLRRFRVDEVPQLSNVLRGEMSLVGPRPERPETIFGTLDYIPYYVNRVQVRHVLTGWAQINYLYAASVDEATRKLEYGFFYIKNVSSSLYHFILLRTFRAMLATAGS